MDQRVIGAKVSSIRHAQGLTTSQLANKVGISQAQISRLENGKQGFRSSTMDKIAKALGVNIVFLVNEDGENSAPVSPKLAEALGHDGFRVFIEQAAAAYLKEPKVLAMLDKALT
jgi:transcriptional regulator with XRE-family HTH domain